MNISFQVYLILKKFIKNPLFMYQSVTNVTSNSSTCFNM